MRSEEILKKTAEGMKEGNKILIQELIRDLEEKGISPVITIDGKVQKLKLIQESELEDFKKELTKFGLQKCDFCLLEEENAAANTSQLPSGNILIIHKKSTKIKTYPAGNNFHWVADFHRDLQNNFFSN
jgi:hypothetical protein